MAHPRVLDIPELQVLVHYPNDGNLHWHHRILLHRIRDALWITLTPDLELARHNLAQVAHRVLDRGGAFPADLADDVYCFDPLDKGVLAYQKRLAKTQAVILGAGDEHEAVAHQWVYDTVGRPDLGEPVAQELVDNAEFFVSLQDRGLVVKNSEIRTCTRIAGNEYDNWLKDMRVEEHDVRLLGVHRPEAKAKRGLALTDAIDMMTEEDMPDWTFEGARVTRELAQAISDSSGNFVSYHSEWIRLSGVSQNSAAGYEHRHCCEVLRLAVSTDQVDISNLACMEQISRRLVQLEMAVARNPYAPDFAGLGVIGDGAVNSDGSARVPKFRSWVAARQKERADIMKQTRLYMEETRGRQNKGKGKGKDKDSKAGKRARGQGEGADTSGSSPGS